MQLQLKYSKIIPPNGFYARTIFNKLYRREKYKNKPISEVIYNHESIHLQQELDFVFGCEKLYILGGCIFYILYHRNTLKSIFQEHLFYFFRKKNDYLSSS